jgi:hypothetical protein
MGPILAVPEAFLKSKGVKNPKMVMYGIGALLVGALVFVVVRKIKRFGAGNYTISKNYDEMSEELNDISIPASETTLTSGEATIISQNLFSAMNRFGTDEKAIIENLSKAQTKADLLLITQKFGVKPYDGLGLSDTFISNQVAAVMKNLSGWLRSELSGPDLKKVKEIYNNLNVPF